MGLADFERGTHSPGHSTFHLERISRLLDRLGNPHLAVPTIHVAGTKGKGSTAAMIASILSAAGHRVGLYTSPSLHAVTERVRVGMEPIEQEEFASLVDRMWPEVEWVDEHGGYGSLMYFEFLTALAFQHFSETNADFQVIEVGLGGRLDATNVVHPAVSVITSISLDHTSVLGDTLPLIASEKAGIIKDGVPVVVAPQDEAALDTICPIAVERGSPMVDVERSLSWQPYHSDLNGQSFTVRGLRDTYKVSLPLIGEYQQENAATAIAAAETLMDAGHPLTKGDILDGLRNARWPGRFQGAPGRWSAGNRRRRAQSLFHGALRRGLHTARRLRAPICGFWGGQWPQRAWDAGGTGGPRPHGDRSTISASKGGISRRDS